MDAYALTLQYYPKYWTITMVAALVAKGKLTEAEYYEITGFVYPATSAPDPQPEEPEEPDTGENEEPEEPDTGENEEPEEPEE